MVVLLDNRDSFVHNLARYAREAGRETTVMRTDRATVDDVRERAPSHIIVSPGPCTPAQAGISNDVITAFAPTTPILGVCLGHLCISEVFGGSWRPARRPTHGRASMVEHSGHPLFAGLPSPFAAARYHSLEVWDDDVPQTLNVIARTTAGEIMGVAHGMLPVVGVQFHPESVLTEVGHAIIENFLAMSAPGGATRGVTSGRLPNA